MVCQKTKGGERIYINSLQNRGTKPNKLYDLRENADKRKLINLFVLYIYLEICGSRYTIIIEKPGQIWTAKSLEKTKVQY